MSKRTGNSGMKRFLLFVLILCMTLAAAVPASGAEAVGNRAETERNIRPAEDGVDALPVIYLQPASVTAAAGTYVSFYVVTGSAGDTFQWQVLKTADGTWTNVTAASGTTSVYSLKAESRHNGFKYRCMVKNSHGKVYSGTALLTVVSEPVITSEPSNVTVTVGASATFSVTASGSGLTYRWQYSKDGGEAWIDVSSGGASRSYTLASAQMRHNGYRYRCTVKNSSGGSVISNVALLTVLAGQPPTITAHPSAVTVTPGQTARFSVRASGGTGTLSYQWQCQKSGSTTWAAVSSASGKTADFYFTAQTTHNGNKYRCVVTDANGASATSNAALLTLQTDPPPTITTHPSSTIVNPGQTARFSVKASGGSGTLSYQWQCLKPGSTTWAAVSSASGKTADFYFTAQTSHNGNKYRCVVTDANGSPATSNAATLTVYQELNIVMPYVSTSCTVGQRFTVTATVTGGTGQLTYRWVRFSISEDTDGIDLGINSATMTDVIRATPSAGYPYWYYYVTVTDGSGASKKSPLVRVDVVSKSQADTEETPTLRALVIGQENYSGGALEGCVGDMNAMGDMLASGGYDVTRRSDLSASGIKSAIASAFSGSDSDDICFFYYSGLGEDGTGRLCGTDNTRLSPAELAAALNDACGGRVIVVLDSRCGDPYLGKSGGIAPVRFNNAVVSAFRAAERQNALRSGTEKLHASALADGRFTVLTACADCGTSGGTFTYHVLRGAGNGFSGTADADSDGRITLNEAYTYMKGKITSFDIQCCGSPDCELFGR